MVYDPIRDCDVPSPAISRRPSLWETPPPGGGHGASGPASGGNGPPPPPPHFQQERSPVPSTSVRPPSGAGLRSLLNDEPEYMPSRRSSDMTVSSATDDDHHASSTSSRPNLAKLLNDPAPPRRPTSSHSATSNSHDSPRMSSPNTSLHPGPLRGSGAAASASSSASRSPLISPNTAHTHLGSPASATSAYPPYDMPPHAGPSSRRSSFDVHAMPPPAEPVRHDHAPAQGHNQASARIRSPTTSVSPRAQNVALPSAPAPVSRPTSSRSTSGGSTVAPVPRAAPVASSSPESYGRRLSTDSTTTADTVRTRSNIPYDPAQGSLAYRTLMPEELANLRIRAAENNPLRRRRRLSSRPSAPAWSAPSPRTDHDDGTRSQGPSRRGSTASAVDARDQFAPQQPHGVKRISDDSPDDGRGGGRPRTDKYSGNAAAVASHYNSRPEVGLQGRELSPIIGLKKFNNWVKSVLIGKFAHRGRGGPGSGAKVLDIGCGKGGDLNKWSKARISLYVGLDIASTSVDQARERYHTMRNARFDAFFVAHDCYSKPLADALPPDLQRRDLYDNVTMQFCMHYAFETPAKARMMIENVSRYLRKGGVFIGTIPNSGLLLERLDQVPEGEELTFGNSCYSIAFTERRHKGIYGHEYRFYLQDAVEDVPEYIVDWENFVALAREYGLELTYRKTFNDILQEEQSSRDFGPLLGIMGVIDANGESAMDADQWEAANLYMGFAFTKV